VCGTCLPKLGHPNGSTVCPFCKTPVRSIRTDHPEKLPANIRAILFGNPMEMYKQANEVWEFQTGHAAIFFRQMDKEIQQIREEGKAESIRIRKESLKLEAAISAGQERNMQLRKRLEELQREEDQQAPAPASAYLPQGSVRSPPIRNPNSATNRAQSPANEYFQLNNDEVMKSPGSKDVFKDRRIFKTPTFK